MKLTKKELKELRIYVTSLKEQNCSIETIKTLVDIYITTLSAQKENKVLKEQKEILEKSKEELKGRRH